MRLDDEQESQNVEDLRDSSGGFAGGMGRGGMSMGRIMLFWPLIKMLLRTKFGWALIAIGVFVYFVNPMGLLSSGSSHTHTKTNENEAVFIKKVLKTTEDVWSQILPKYGYKYTKPIMVLYRGHTVSGCGMASSQVGPFYCPVDKKVYLDLGFFDELRRVHHASGDFAQAYVLAHEIGHHVQDILGTLKKVHTLQQRALRRGNKTASNHLQIPVELQADCYAGIWAHYMKSRLDKGDIDEALNAASRIGDDTLQKEAQGYVVPDSFTHGTSKQREKWFYEGYKSGNLRACNTFQ